MKKKIIIDRDKIDAKEIARRQDFSKILNQIPAYSGSPFYLKGWFYVSLASISLIVMLSLTLYDAPIGEHKDKIVTLNSNAFHEFKVIDTNEKTQYETTEKNQKIKQEKFNFDVPFSIYKINGALGGEIIHSTGTKIQFPSKVFLDENGNLVENEVQVYYREINDPVDIVHSGIFMNHESSNLNNSSLSFGIYEILAFYDNKPLFVKESKDILISIKDINQENNFNVYYFDEGNNKWDYKGQSSIVLSGVQKSKSLIQEENIDLKSLENKVKKAHDLYQFALKNTNDFKKQEPLKPISEGNKDRQFVLDVDPKEFPELSLYKNILFEVEKNDPNFSSSVYNENWSDVILSEKEKGKTYYLTLFKSGIKKTFTVFPVFSGVDLEIAMNYYTKSFEKYEKELSYKKNEEQKAKEYYEEQLAIWEDAKEKKLLNIESNIKDNKPTIVAKVIKISNFGIWNLGNYK